MTLGDIATACRACGLFVMGTLEEDGDTLVLIGADASFWTYFTASPDFRDTSPNPIDRYSKRIINAIAAGAQTHFPSDGPPYDPFIAWALKSGRFWQSPTGMMVHDTAGLMISIRGAIRTDLSNAPTVDQNSPCATCVDRPCISACPVSALNGDTFYDVPKCKAYLGTADGAECMGKGCIARRACPVSQRFNRPDAQSAFHMQAFHPQK